MNRAHTFLSSFFYSSNAGLIQEILGAKFYNRSADNRLLKNGFLVFKNSVSELLSKPFLLSLCRKLEDVEPLQGRSEIKITVRSDLFDLTQEIFYGILKHAEVRQSLDDWFKWSFRVLNVHAYMIQNVESTATAYGSTAVPHIDGSRTDIIKLFVALSDVTENHGPMVCSGRFPITSEDGCSISPGGNSKITCEAGDIFLCATNIFYHSATIPRPDFRRYLLVYTLVGCKHESDYFRSMSDRDFYLSIN
jgi:hypothetical protein